MSVVKIVLLVLQMLSCVLLTVVIAFQNSKDGGLSALTGGSSDTFFGKGGAQNLDKKLERITKYIAVAFVLLTLFVSLLYTAA